VGLILTFRHLSSGADRKCCMHRHTLHAIFMHHALGQCLSEHYREWSGIVSLSRVKHKH